jgi:hypothetical protein
MDTPSKGFEVRQWDYLKTKLSFLKDNNKTAKEIFNYIRRIVRQEVGMAVFIDRMGNSPITSNGAFENENKKDSI